MEGAGDANRNALKTQELKNRANDKKSNREHANHVEKHARRRKERENFSLLKALYPDFVEWRRGTPRLYTVEGERNCRDYVACTVVGSGINCMIGDNNLPMIYNMTLPTLLHKGTFPIVADSSEPGFILHAATFGAIARAWS